MTNKALEEMRERAKISQNELDYSLGYIDGYDNSELKNQIKIFRELHKLVQGYL